MVNKSTVIYVAVFLVTIMFGSPACKAQQAPKIFAQKLIDDTVAQHSDLPIMIMHLTPPGRTDNIAAACVSTKPCLGEKSGDDDLDVIKHSLDIVERQQNGTLCGVLVPLKDQAGKTIGALGMVFKVHSGKKDADYLGRAEEIRDRLQKKIPTLESLFEPIK